MMFKKVLFDDFESILLQKLCLNRYYLMILSQCYYKSSIVQHENEI